MKVSTNRFGKKFALLLALVIGITAVPVLTPQRAAAAPYTCSTDFYWVVDDTVNTQLYSGDPATNDLTNPLGPTSAVNGYNAIGYNTQDNYIWGLSTEGATEARLVRIHADGTAELAYPSVPAGLPVDSYQAGAFDENGILWVTVVSGDNTIYGIDVANNTAVALPLSTTLPNVRIIDFAYVDGYLYTTSGGDITTDLKTYRIDLSNGNTTVSNPMTGMNLVSGSMGYAPSLWSAGGHIYFYYAAGALPEENGVYEILDYDTPNPSFKLRNNIDGHPSGDGASCVTADSPFEIVAADDDFTSNPIQSCDGGVAGNIFDNDTLYGDDFDPSSVNLTVEDNGGLTGVNLDANGNVALPASCRDPGDYAVVYQICDVVSPDVCNTGNITLRVLGVSAPGPSDPGTSAENGSGTLAPTGDNMSTLIGVGLSLIAAAVLLLTIGRTRLGKARA